MDFFSLYLTVRLFRCYLIYSSIYPSVWKFFTSFLFTSHVFKQFLLYARNSHEVEGHLWCHFGKVRIQFWRHFDSRSQVMAGKLGGLLPFGYYPLYIAEYTTAFQASDWLYFLRHGIKLYTLHKTKTEAKPDPR